VFSPQNITCFGDVVWLGILARILGDIKLVSSEHYLAYSGNCGRSNEVDRQISYVQVLLRIKVNEKSVSRDGFFVVLLCIFNNSV